MDILRLLNGTERSRGQEIRFEKGETLFQEGDLCKGVGFVMQGRIKIVSYTLEGREVVYNDLGPGSLFGNNLVFTKEPFYRGAVIGVEAGDILFFEKTDLLSVLSDNQAFLEAYLSIQSEFGKGLNFQIKLLSFSSAEERFDYYLQSHKGRIQYRSISALAATLFLSRETLSRLLHRLKEEKKIAMQGKEILSL